MKRVLLLSLAFLVLRFVTSGQEIDRNRIINVTFNTSNPSELATNRGRLIWKDVDGGSGNYFLKYFSGSEITILDSNLAGVTASIEGDYVAWNTASEQVKVYNTRTWNTTLIGPSYNPNAGRRVALANGLLAYARRKSGSGAEIVLRNIPAGTDTVFDAAVWNTEPSVHHGQLAWVGSSSESTAAPSDVFFYDGFETRNISSPPGLTNRNPIVRDGQVLWIRSGGPAATVELFTGDTVLTVTQATPPVAVVGYDLSDGIAVAGTVDTVTGASQVRILNTETMQSTTLADTLPVSSLHIDNGLATWASGVQFDRVLKKYYVIPELLETWGITDNPVLDDGIVAWTLGDAVEMSVPVTDQRLTTDGVNGWEQTRFKNVDDGHILWGNYANSIRMRLFYWNGSTTTRLTDSSIYKDFAMTNDGIAIWREDFNTLWVYNGAGQPVMIIDSLQCENMYVANGAIGFFGFRLNGGSNVNQAWIYLLAGDSLIQLTNDTSQTAANRTVLVDGNTACWEREVDQENMLMFYDGGAISRISDSSILSLYSYQKGKIIWSERRNGIYQLMLYNTASHTQSQITSGAYDISTFVSDGDHIVFLEPGPTPSEQIMWHYDIATAQMHKVAHATVGPLFRWMWMGNGKFAWRQRNETYVYDGAIITQLTEDGGTDQADQTLTVADIDSEYVLWIQNGDVYKGKLQPRPSFDAFNISGNAPLSVSFFNRSWNGTRSHMWDFGDGATSTEDNPVHTYQNPGAYTVTLAVTGPGGSVQERKIGLVRARSTSSVRGDERGVPERFVLHQNYPNPFNPITVIEYELPRSEHVTLRIYDVLGRLVKTLVEERQEAGRQSVVVQAEGLSSGIYFYTIAAGSYHSSQKLVILK